MSEAIRDFAAVVLVVFDGAGGRTSSLLLLDDLGRCPEALSVSSTTTEPATLAMVAASTAFPEAGLRLAFAVAAALLSCTVRTTTVPKASAVRQGYGGWVMAVHAALIKPLGIHTWGDKK